MLINLEGVHMFDFFKFRNNNIGMIKTGAQGALIGMAFAVTKIMDCEEHPIATAGTILSLLVIGIYICTLPSTPKVIYKTSQPAVGGEENGFYLIESNSPSLK